MLLLCRMQQSLDALIINRENNRLTSLSNHGSQCRLGLSSDSERKNKNTKKLTEEKLFKNGLSRYEFGRADLND